MNPYVRLVGLGTFWGTSFLLVKIALEGLPPLGVALSRCLFGAVTLWAYVLVTRRRVPTDPLLWWHLGVVGVFANALPFALFSWGELYVTSAIAGVYNATTPLFTVLLAIMLLPAERATRARVTGLVLGTVGVAIVLGPWQGTGTNSLLGQLACLAAGASYAVGLLYVRRYVSPLRLDVAAQTAVQLTLATLLLAVVTPFGGGSVDMTWPVFAAVFAMGAVGTGVAMLVFNGLIRDLGATGTSLVTFIPPVVAVALGAAVLGEPVTWNLFAGAVVVIAGVRLAR